MLLKSTINKRLVGLYNHLRRSGQLYDEGCERRRPWRVTDGTGAVDRALTVTTVPAAGTDVFEMRRRKRVERLKFRWLRQQLSGKARAARRRTRSDDQVPLRSDSVVDDDVAMTTTSGAGRRMNISAITLPRTARMRNSIRSHPKQAEQLRRYYDDHIRDSSGGAEAVDASRDHDQRHGAPGARRADPW